MHTLYKLRNTPKPSSFILTSTDFEEKHKLVGTFQNMLHTTQLLERSSSIFWPVGHLLKIHTTVKETRFYYDVVCPFAYGELQAILD